MGPQTMTKKTMDHRYCILPCSEFPTKRRFEKNTNAAYQCRALPSEEENNHRSMVSNVLRFSPLFDDHEKLLVILGRGANEHVVVAGDEHDGAHRSAHVQQRHPLQDVFLNRRGSISTGGG